MSTAGPNYGTATDISSNPGGSFVGGLAAWTNITNMSANGADATSVTSAGNNATDTAKIVSLGFSIPGGATIQGIVLTFSGHDSSGTHQGTLFMQLFKAGSPTGTAKSFQMNTGGSDSVYSEGANNDLWGGTFTSSDINNAGFGVGLQEQSASGSNTVNIVNVQLTVYYTGGSATVVISNNDKLWLGGD